MGGCVNDCSRVLVMMDVWELKECWNRIYMSTLVLLDKGIYSQIWNCLKLGRLVDRQNGQNEPVNEQCQIEPLTPIRFLLTNLFI